MNQLSSLYVIVLCVIIGLGGILKTLSGVEVGWVVVGVAVVAYFFNCIDLIIYYLQ